MEIEQKLKNAIKHQPRRYTTVKDIKTNELIEVHDLDTGLIWIKRNGKWTWIQ